MSNLAITADDLGKRYRIGSATARPQTLKEVLASGLTAPRRNWARLRRLSTFDDTDAPDVIWALRHVTFDLKHGDVLGVIGHNGAGKSTLLKILSRITHPTTGRARIAGRVGSLLEVGTGFHPELTGRDNVFLNGSILGMNRADIARRFDQIVEFSGIAKFIDTPVKRYSSGMYLRLAFAVAAHLEPDVLIVDEVLAVGDAEFQQKCLLKMGDVANAGRTILFVSHNLGAIQRLCSRSLLLEKGTIIADGKTSEVFKRYFSTHGANTPPGSWLDVTNAPRSGSGIARFSAVRYFCPDSAAGHRPFPNGPLDVMVRIRTEVPVGRVSLAIAIRDQHGTKLINADTDSIVGPSRVLRDQESTWMFRLSRVFLKPGTYQLDLWLADPAGNPYDRIPSALRFEIVDLQPAAIGIRLDRRYDGLVLCDYNVMQVSQSVTQELGGTPVV